MNKASTIEISKSSLLSLKAEVLRKHYEINQAKQKAQVQQPTKLKSKTLKNDSPKEPSNKGVNERQNRDEIEDENLLEKSRKMLESKARLYDKLAKRPANLTEEEIEINKQFLVEFDRKPREELNNESEEEQHDSDEYDPANNSDEEWFDYIDCLGRTRRCLRKDINYLKEKDHELSKTIDAKRLPKEEPNWKIDTKGEQNIEKRIEPNETQIFAENSELLSRDMRRELLRVEWEKQEQELMNKKDVHYQDVLFNEARSHGVGYYAFSKDDDVRSKQQEELIKLREQTTQQQKANLDQKALREKQLAVRLKAARNRKRTRMGLPPEEDEPEESPVPEVKTSDNEQRNIAKKEAAEKLKDEARKRVVRPWDIGKEGLKKHYEYSQEEWVDKKRIERPKEFAPPSLYRGDPIKQLPNEDVPDIDKSLFFTTKRPKKYMPVDKPKDIWVAASIPPPNFERKVAASINPYKNNSYTEEASCSEPFSFIPAPIVDEDVDLEEPIEEEPRNVNVNVERRGIEIAPPPTFEYYGPNQTKSTNFASKQSLEDSIAAGLKYLREQAEKKELAAEKRKYI